MVNHITRKPQKNFEPKILKNKKVLAKKLKLFFSNLPIFGHISGIKCYSEWFTLIPTVICIAMYWITQGLTVWAIKVFDSFQFFEKIRKLKFFPKKLFWTFFSVKFLFQNFFAQIFLEDSWQYVLPTGKWKLYRFHVSIQKF